MRAAHGGEADRSRRCDPATSSRTRLKRVWTGRGRERRLQSPGDPVPGLTVARGDRPARLLPSTCARSASPSRRPISNGALLDHADVTRMLIVDLFHARNNPARAKPRRRKAGGRCPGDQDPPGRPRRRIESADQPTASCSRYLNLVKRHAPHQLLPDRGGWFGIDPSAICRSSWTSHATSRTCRSRVRGWKPVGLLAASPKPCTCAAARSRAAASAGPTGREDFRTEILGLIKAQMVKNAVIVPVGAKGGFIVQAASDRRRATARRSFAEGIECYKTVHARAPRAITDNLEGRRGGAAARTPCGMTATTPTS